MEAKKNTAGNRGKKADIHPKISKFSGIVTALWVSRCLFKREAWLKLSAAKPPGFAAIIFFPISFYNWINVIFLFFFLFIVIYLFSYKDFNLKFKKLQNKWRPWATMDIYYKEYFKPIENMPSCWCIQNSLTKQGYKFGTLERGISLFLSDLLNVL